ncbi:MAG: hypothetical protein M3T56_10285 [Chloroflexota bacterium]|nr:hypothetical protein [Chloroflexota bacterium]
MADRRLIAQSITDSSQVAQLIRRCGPWSGLFFTWCLPFIDDDSRLDGDPETLRAMVLGRWTEVISVADVTEMIATMNDLDLAIWYEVIDSPAERYLYFPRFTVHQMLRIDRYGPSRRPAPPGWVPEEGHPYHKNDDARRSEAKVEDLKVKKPQRDRRRTRRVPKRRPAPDPLGCGRCKQRRCGRFGNRWSTAGFRFGAKRFTNGDGRHASSRLPPSPLLSPPHG